MIGGRDEHEALPHRVNASTHPGFALVAALGGVVFFALGMAMGHEGMRALGVIAVLACVAIAATGTIRYEWGESAEGEELFRIVRWWGSRSVPMANLREVRMGGTLSTLPTATVKFEGLPTLSLNLTWGAHLQLVNHLRSRLGPAPPSFDPLSGVVRIDALAGMKSEHCVRCGSTTFVRPIRVTARRGIHLLVFSTWASRHFELPVCVYHRWPRYLSTHLVNLSVLPALLLVLVFWGTADTMGWDPVLTRVAQWSAVASGLGWLLLLANEVHRYPLDSVFLGVRLGWLQSDFEHSRLVIGSDRVREAIEAHLSKGNAVRAAVDHSVAML